MALDYKIEWFRDGESPSNQGAFIHLGKDIPCYMDFITKEEYALLEDADKCDLVTSLFAIEGVVEVSCKAYRVYVIKAELFYWESILASVLLLLKSTLSEDSLNERPGSRLELETTLDRREL